MKRFYIILIVLFGLFLMPTVTFACEKIVVNHSCTKETSKTQKDDCCCKANHSKDKNHDGCGGKCGHSMCGCGSVCNGGISFLNELQFKSNSFNFYSEKQKFYSSETFISSGFHSLWLIPKIG
ncbi:hypothetical protein [Flavobacterium soyae]|uniref:Uncharacterized protein n=1 Tax=Flavobacterium soyae TaxID=2903098 RepID=A0ABZ2UEG4_9FLAO